ncbi:PAS domain-containing protein [Starkeya sp. ORNL1]|nr:ATP-binding protein [Starkeya sp. ORNL1]QJP12525.1 PAS domain-containing protein [Starkeya sp. ORNL1]
MVESAARHLSHTRGDAAPGSSDPELADHASESIIVFDLAGKIRYWNPASERLYGWTAIGAVGRNIEDLYSNEAFHSKDWRSLLQEGRWQGVIRRRTSWGGHITVAVRQIVRCNPEGQPRDVVEYGASDGTGAGTLQDPAPHRLAAASWELDTSGARSLLEAISLTPRQAMSERLEQPDWTDQLLAHTRIVDVNERAAHLVGAYAGRARMIGQAVRTFWPPESRGVLAELIADVATDRLGDMPRTRRPASDGILRDPIVTVWRGKALERSHTVFVAVNGEADDDRSFWYLRASEQRYRNLIHHLPTALLQVDASRIGLVLAELKDSGVRDLNAYIDTHPELVDFANNVVRITEVNQKAVTLLGGAAPADLIRPISFLFAASPDMARRVMVARFEGKRNFAEILKVRTLGGETLDVQLSATFPAPPEMLDRTLIALEDVTETLRTERRLRQLEADFAHAARISTLGELATSIAHEVNQPLSAIVTNGETSLRWLTRDIPNLAKVEQLTARIVASARRASEIIHRLRAMAVRDAPERTTLHLNEVVEEALLFVRHDLEARSIELSLKPDAGLSPIVADRVQLQQVIVNLLVNSIQAISNGDRAVRKLDIVTRDDGAGSVSFAIHDSGPGIADEDLDRIFDSFFSTKSAGMGIGLTICKSIVTSHGGSIVASNHPDGGAQFEFALPAALPEAA